MNYQRRPCGLAVENFPALPEKAVQPAWHLNGLKWNVFCCKHLICSFWTVGVTRSKTGVKCPKHCLSAVRFFILLVLKATEKGGKKTHTGFPQKRRQARVGSLLRQNECGLRTIDHLSPDYNRPQGNWCWLWIPPLFSESLLVTAPPPILTAQSRRDWDLLAMWILVCVCVCSIQTGQVQRFVSNNNIYFRNVLVWKPVEVTVNALGVFVGFISTTARAAGEGEQPEKDWTK